MNKLVSPLWAEAREESAGTDDQGGIDRDWCSGGSADQSLSAQWACGPTIVWHRIKVAILISTAQRTGVDISKCTIMSSSNVTVWLPLIMLKYLSQVMKPKPWPHVMFWCAICLPASRILVMNHLTDIFETTPSGYCSASWSFRWRVIMQMWRLII